MTKRIIILGSKGMLGQMVSQYFRKENFNVIIFDKRFTSDHMIQYVDELNSYDDAIIVNCIGKIKQKTIDSNELFLSNTLLPLEISRRLKNSHIFIHPSTDCVFSGHASSPYPSYNAHDASDVYGISKSMGEKAISTRINSLIIRVSIIGPDTNSNKGLLSWFLSNQDGVHLDGYLNHYWNGITTFEWCNRLNFILQDDSLLNSLLSKKFIQLGTQKIYSKYDMLQLFNQIYNRNIIINPISTDKEVYRCLLPEWTSKSLEEQLFDLAIN
jgi:dTDP-4-dehydrorhamnose reductase